MSLERVAVVGGGAWGTALAQAACLAGREVSLVVRRPEVADEINTRHTSAAVLPQVQLHPRLAARLDLAEADLVILAVPAQQTRAAIEALDPSRLEDRPVILTAKGLEHGTLRRQSEILGESLPTARPHVLSGPSFAVDVARGHPTAVTLAGCDSLDTEAIAACLAGPSLRLYASNDLAGVELAGALKNVYALACGAVEGAGLGLSARSALLARAYAEMSRIVVALGGSAQSLTGLAGLGDLTLSCTSAQSRNYRFGMALGSGRMASELMAEDGELAEGVMTTPVAHELARRAGVEAPLVAAVAAVLDGRHTIETVVAELMARPLKREV